jgi:serine/threonine protein kinase
MEQVLDFITQTARGLEYAHARGAIHRNVKPGNLLVSLDGVVKILDMGLAHYDDESGERLTQMGQMMGTVDYMSPEQANDARKADERSDIYSLGCTMYRLLTGQLPYTAKNAVAKAIAHAQAPIPPLRSLRSDAPELLERLYQRMVAKSPAERFQSMTELIAALAVCHGGQPAVTAVPQATPPSRSAPPPPASTTANARQRKKTRRKDVTAMLAIGIALLIILGGLLVLWLS